MGGIGRKLNAVKFICPNKGRLIQILLSTLSIFSFMTGHLSYRVLKGWIVVGLKISSLLSLIIDKFLKYISLSINIFSAEHIIMRGALSELWACSETQHRPRSRQSSAALQGFSVAILMRVTSDCCVGVFSVASIQEHDLATFRPHHSPESLVWNKASVHYKPSMVGCYENLMRGLMAILTQIRGGNVWIMNTVLRHYCHNFRWQISWRDQSV